MAQIMTFDRPELVGISGFRVMWDESVPLAEDGVVAFTDAKIKDRHGSAVWHPSQRQGKPGPIAFDALQRSVLVRFPGADEMIARELRSGARVKKVELVLPFRDTELWPVWGRDLWDPQTGGYNARRNWGVDQLYRTNQPNWHAVAYALRRPWTADPELAPTYNAFLNGAGYWAHGGAQDERQDRFPTRFGPTEVSSYRPEGRMDVTAVLTEPAFGQTLGQRLRVLSEHGFILRKWETYDHRYFNGVYEWATATGGRAVMIQTPRLVVTLVAEDVGQAVTLPPAIDPRELARELRANGTGGTPPARLLSEAELMAFNARVMAKPEWMPDWQYQRVRELRELRNLGRKSALEPDMFFDIFLSHHIVTNMYGTRENKVQAPAPPYERYKAWVDLLLSRQPRGWSGFEAAKEMAQWYTYGEALPQPARDAIKTYWTAWLMPEQETAPTVQERHNPRHDRPTLIHPMADQLWGQKELKGGTSTTVSDTYYALTGDWRGNKSFYRSGFNYEMSTQNFNTTASSGALLGGEIIGSELAIRDGRHGFQSFPLQLWAWDNGSSQEHIDHYYFSITCSGNKAVYDFGPTPYDRQMGRSVVTYNMEELLGAWHPNLRRFIAPASRTTLEHVLVATDGVQHIMHTLSRDGALFDFDKPQHVPKGMNLLGQEVPPQIVALQTMTQPWAPAYMVHLVDDKPLPFYATHRTGLAWRRAFLHKHFGLASLNVTMPRLQVLAQWRREPQRVDQNTDLGTMDLRFGMNETRFASTAAGHLGRSGSTWNLQHRNKLLSVSSPMAYWNGPNGVGVPGDGTKHLIRSLQTSVILFNYQSPPTWEIHVAGRRVDALPATARQGEPILIRDGVTWIGIVPLHSTDLGRDAQVTIEPGTTQMFGQVEVASALTINNFLLRRDRPLAHGEDDFERIDDGYGGFAVEFYNQEDWPSFDAFAQHMAAAAAAQQQQFDPDRAFLTTTYRSGDDVLTLGTPTRDREEKGRDQPTFHINGEPAFPRGLLRQTDHTVVGVAGTLELAGATLRHRESATAALFHEPVTRTWRAMIPTPRGSWLHLDLPDGRRVRTDGRVNLLDLTLHGDGHLELWHSLKPGAQPGETFARALILDGLATQPSISVNGQAVTATATPELGPQTWALPLNAQPQLPDTASIRQRIAAPE